MNQIISDGIEKGCKAYNDLNPGRYRGDITRCEEIYAATAKELLKVHGDDLKPPVKKKLEALLKKSMHLEQRYNVPGSPVDILAFEFLLAFHTQLSTGRAGSGKEKTQRQKTYEIITKAIADAEPPSREGNYGECAKIYMNAAERVLKMGGAQSGFKAVVVKCKQSTDEYHITLDLWEAFRTAISFPADTIVRALSRGKGLFNRNEIDECVSTYTAAAKTLLGTLEFPQHDELKLREVLEQCEKRVDAEANAWGLRSSKASCPE